jgi:antitoxin VapB
MTLAIKDRETVTLLEEIGAATGREVGDVVRDIVRREADRIRKERDFQERDFQERLARLEEISCRAAAKIPRDALSPDEIIGYDEWGLPT